MSLIERQICEISKIRAAMPMGSKLDCRVIPGRVHLEVIRVPKTRHGSGTRAMLALVGMCDSHDLELICTVDPTDDANDPDTDALLRWYARFGFELTGTDELSGQPIIFRQPNLAKGR